MPRQRSVGRSAAQCSLAVPVLQRPQVVVPAAESGAPACVAAARRAGRYTTGMTARSLMTRSFMRMNSAARLTGSSSASRGAEGAVVLVVAPARDVAALPLVGLRARPPTSTNCSHEQLGSGCAMVVRVHLHVGIELGVGVGIATSDEKNTDAVTDFSSSVDAGLLAGLLDDRLGLLARRVDRGLEDELELLAVLRADAVGAALPAGRVRAAGWPCRR